MNRSKFCGEVIVCVTVVSSRVNAASMVVGHGHRMTMDRAVGRGPASAVVAAASSHFSLVHDDKHVDCGVEVEVRTRPRAPNLSAHTNLFATGLETPS